jgi:DNA-binding NtrC family response regulator
MGTDGMPPTKTALVVDDDHAQAHATARLLRLEDFDAVIATDIESAMTALSQHPIHLALVDMHLGHERGSDLIERIRSEYPALPTILLSGSEPDELETEALRCGASAALAKPFDLSQLLEIVAAIADSP